ncbi:Catechol 2,3-dioxygenase [Epibacterium ulvae]|uniref:Catechol 2,3-dioxygenase n=1 Tax=Epibacterium ulvae TaxID=1156985 RepID=A0A1G5PKD0_9RHOB|nr:VOC family protein [Epibacterium ulvae]SCZ49963.1 Catechol 2,3-dioxygenase [Epibacterium ulvae]
MTAYLEHANVTVSNPEQTAAWMEDIFGWKIRWQGDAMESGHTIHIGSETSYVALYAPDASPTNGPRSYDTRGGLNHLALVVDDFEDTRAKVIAAGFTPGDIHSYEPGQRFYFKDDNNIEFEVVHYGTPPLT